MLKLRKYFKPYFFLFLAVIALLFLQAVSDLNLPRYMADIINIGIQQGGIESGVPVQISQNGMDLLQFFMSDSEKKDLSAAYTPSSPINSQILDSVFSEVQNSAYWLKDDQSHEQIEQLEQIIGKSAWTMSNMLKATQTSDGETEIIQADFSAFDLNEVYALLPRLKEISPDVLLQAQSTETEPSLLTQSAKILTLKFYKELQIDATRIQNNYMLNTGGIMLLIALCGGVAAILTGFYSSRIGAGIARDLRSAIFKKVGRFTSAEFEKFSTASLITRTTNDVSNIQMVTTMGVRFIFFSPIMVIGGVVMALQKSMSMSWIIAMASLVVIGVISVIFSIVTSKFQLIQKLIDRLNLVSRETVSGLMVIRAFGAEKFEKDRFEEANRDLAKTNLFVNRIMSVMMPAMMLIMNCTSILVIWNGSHQVSIGAMQVGDMIAFMNYTMQIIMSFLMISMMFVFLPRAQVSANRIAEILDVEVSIKDPQMPLAMKPEMKGFVEFRDVSFRYEGAEEAVIHHISFTARPGQTTAFIGPTGSGKSTIVKLIPRFADVSEGQVLVNGVDVRELSQADLRSKIGYIPQKNILMSGTIESNIRYGCENASDEEIRNAAETAQALEFIIEKEDGFAADISQGGANVSGGQRQRLAIARALAIKPDIFIFDDSFSALDFKTDRSLRAALKKSTAHSAVLIVAQRVNTIMDAEQIFVIDEGRILAQGIHKELLRTCPEYYEIASTQLTKEELENA